MQTGQDSAAGNTIVVRLPGVLVDLFPGSLRRVDIEATNVAEMVAALDALWPGMGDRLCDSTPSVRRHINIFHDGQRCTLSTPLPPGAEVFVLTAISGG